MPPSLYATLLLAPALLAAAATFQTNSLVVTRAGDGTAANSPASATNMVPLSLAEYSLSRAAGGGPLTATATANVLTVQSTAAAAAANAALGAYQLSVPADSCDW